jgi:glucan biosynthesis protein C
MSPQAEQRLPQNRNISETTLSSPAQTAMPIDNHLPFLDHLRVALTILVIMIHLAFTYGALPPWYYQEKTSNGITIDLLTFFACINQAFIMSCFFMLAAYFTEKSYRRKGTSAFLRRRVLRLALPLILYDLFLHPFALYLGQKKTVGYQLFFLQYLRHFPGIGNGPLWYIVVLLLFTFLYVALDKMPGAFFHNTGRSLTLWGIILFTLILSLTTFLSRIWFPIALTFTMSQILTKAEFAYIPSYLSLFILGVLAARHNWLRNLPSCAGKFGPGIALAAILLYPPLALISGIRENPAPFLGGIHWQSLSYALWESVVCVGMCLGLPLFFRQYLNHHTRWGNILSAQTYIVYLIHTPVIVCFAYAFRNIPLHPLMKFFLASLITVPLCFLCGFILHKINFVRHIL